MNTDLELFATGLVLSAAAEMPFDTYLSLWDRKMEHLNQDWYLQASRKEWIFQSYFWGDPNGE